MSTGRVLTHDQQLKELREAVLAMAIALGEALPPAPDVIRTLNALTDTYDRT